MPTASFNFNYYPSSVLDPHTAFLLYAAAALAILSALVMLLFSLFPGTPRALRIWGGSLLGTGLITLGITWFYARNNPELTSPVFAPRTMLASLWENYKKDFVAPSNGRTIDNQRGGITTSEGESYTLLRAVWMDDQATFDASWQWTKANLQRNDHLFSWLYGTQKNGTMGVLTDQNGENTATDADSDIALALVFAYARWQEPSYLQAAVPIIRAIWQKETFTAQGKRYLGPSDATVAAKSQRQLLDPSYFSPYAYRIFGTLIKDEDWNALIDTSYQILDNSIALGLDKKSSAGLPPDWVVIDTATGGLGASENPGQSTNFGYDAIRVPWRIALDWQWSGDPRARTVLSKMGFLDSVWNRDAALNAVYAHDGTPVSPLYQSPAAYGGAIGYFMVSAPDAAREVYVRKLQSLYDPDTQTWRLPLNYYDANIAWFGMALYNDALPDLFSLLSSSSTTPASSNH